MPNVQRSILNFQLKEPLTNLPKISSVTFKLSLVLYAQILFASTLRAQLNWSRADSLFGELPSSVKVFMSNDSLAGKPFIAYYVEALLKDRKLDFTTQAGYGKRFTPTEYYTQQKNPVLVVNGTFFSFQTNQNLNLLVKNKKLLSYNVTALKGKGNDSNYFYYPTRSAIAISKKRKADVAWTFTDSAIKYVYAFEDSPAIAKGKDPIPTINKLRRYD